MLHTWGGSVEAYLVYGILPLGFGLGIRVLHSQVLQFDDVAVGNGVMGKVRHQEEVAETVVKFHLRGNQIVVADAEVGGEEPLQVAFTLDGAAHGGIFLIGPGDEFKTGTPLAFVGHGIKLVHKTFEVDAVLLLILFKHKVIVLLAHVVVGDAQYRTLPSVPTMVSIP